MDDDVDRFFDTYTNHVRREWSAGSTDQFLANEQELALPDRFLLHPPRIRADEISALDELSPHGIPLPETYRSFLQAYSFSELDLPWMAFPSTMTADPIEELRVLQSDFSHENLFPVAYEEDRSGVFCLDYRTPRDEPAVCLWRYGFDSSAGSLVTSAFSSFTSLVRVLTEVLQIPGGLHFEDEPAREQIEAIERLRSIDPGGFGGPGWEEWWGQKILAGRRVVGPE